MSQQESFGARQSTRVVTATRRQAVAEEKARILGRKQAPPSDLEKAAAQWEKEREARAKKAREEQLSVSRLTETHPFSLQRVSLRADGIAADEEVEWKAYRPPREGKPRRRRLGGIAVGSFALRLIQRERAGGSSRVVTDPRARALEEAGRRWEEQRTASNPRR